MMTRLLFMIALAALPGWIAAQGTGPSTGTGAAATPAPSATPAQGAAPAPSATPAQGPTRTPGAMPSMGPGQGMGSGKSFGSPAMMMEMERAKNKEKAKARANADTGQMQFNPSNTPGWFRLMTAEERTQYQQKMLSMKSLDECNAYAAEHQAALAARAKAEQNRTLPAPKQDACKQMQDRGLFAKK
jgi:hypothetical protein